MSFVWSRISASARLGRAILFAFQCRSKALCCWGSKILFKKQQRDESQQRTGESTIKSPPKRRMRKHIMNTTRFLFPFFDPKSDKHEIALARARACESSIFIFVSERERERRHQRFWFEHVVCAAESRRVEVILNNGQSSQRVWEDCYSHDDDKLFTIQSITFPVFTFTFTFAKSKGKKANKTY